MSPTNAHRAPARLPVGPPTNSLRSIPENFAFHSSPESFIASRMQQAIDADPTLFSKRIPIRAKILNRNVAVISSYKQIRAVLDHADTESDDPPYEARAAYNELMRDFFPPPNLLLADGCPHKDMRPPWDTSLAALKGVGDVVSTMVVELFETISSGHEIDLYDICKQLSWRILLKVSLDLDRDHELFHTIQTLQEDLLRGQFSLFPVSVNLRWWQSPRSRGVEARKKIQQVITGRLLQLSVSGNRIDRTCLARIITTCRDVSTDAARDHLLMMTSSLACKGLASLLTAFLLNLFLFERGGVKLHAEIGSISAETRAQRLKSIYLETQRLSPPIVGVMRRVKHETILEGDSQEPDTLLPAGWDAWLYLVGAGRDKLVFGETFLLFNPDRYPEDVSEPIGFGVGAKSCLGKDLIQSIVTGVADTLLDNGIALNGQVSSPGLRGWLGWNEATPEQWAADLKQLPTQHPRKPVMVKVAKAAAE